MVRTREVCFHPFVFPCVPVSLRPCLFPLRVVFSPPYTLQLVAYKSRKVSPLLGYWTFSPTLFWSFVFSSALPIAAQRPFSIGDDHPTVHLLERYLFTSGECDFFDPRDRSATSRVIGDILPSPLIAARFYPVFFLFPSDLHFLAVFPVTTPRGPRSPTALFTIPLSLFPGRYRYPLPVFSFVLRQARNPFLRVDKRFGSARLFSIFGPLLILLRP